nr:retrotransposon protein, putative, Ty1-copia subclass [Tanacetum cinerariifolium]
MLKELKTLFAQQAEQELLQITRDFHSCRQKKGQSVSSYVLKMKGYIDNLERLGHPVTLGLGTVNELHAMLKLHEQTLPKSNAPALNAIRAGKVQKGHWKRNCPQYLAELMKKKKNTASGAGGSVFRGFFEKQKLTGPNFIDWYRQLRIVLSIEDKLNYLEQPIAPVPVAPAGQQVAPEILAAHTAWVKGSKEIAGLMLMTMELEIQRNLEPLHVHEMLKELKTLFAQQAEQELLQTTRDFHSCGQEEGKSVSSYVLKMKGYIDNLERLWHPVTLGLGVSLILIGLRKEYDGFVQNYNMHSMRKTVNELHAMLKLHEQTLPKSNAPALNAIRAGKVQKSNKHKKSHSQKGAKGQNQGKGKFAPKPKIPPPPKRENPAKESICHERGEIENWKRNCPQYLAELMKKKKKNTASGAGGSGIFVIELNTILNRSWIYDTGCGTHIYNTTQGLRASRKLKPRALSLYVGNGQREAVEAIGAFYLCLPSGLEIVLNNCHYAPSITRGVNFCFPFIRGWDGIFEIDLSNSLTNESSVYAVSNKRAKLDLDSALLWHCRLGHINKKRIEKLQHDGLLDSSDFTAFKKCVSCMSEFLDLLKDHGIIAHHTPPYTPQHNGVSERRNRTLLDMVRSMMSQTTLPKSFWDYALETVARILNMVPTKKVEKTPYEVWHRKAPKLSYLKVRGCVALVKRDTLTKPDNKWLFKKKTDMDGNVHIYKARPVAKGYTQNPGIDYEETFSPVADIRAIRILIAIAAYYDYEIWQMDVKTAFLNGYLNEEVYMEQPESFVNLKYSNRVCKLKRSIYGLKQASRQWNKRFDDEIKRFGFTQNRDEPCVYLKASGSNITFLILYVDDILIMRNSIPMLQSVKTYRGKCFAMKDLGEAAYILGIKIYRDRSKRLIGLCQSAYIKKILKRYCMENSKRGSIPMQEKLKLSKSQGASTPAEMKCMLNVPYASAVGSIMYAVRCTRPNVAFAQNITSRFQQNPGDIYLTNVKNILKYLRNTKDMFLVYGGDLKRELRVSCYIDAGYLTDADDLKSQTGYVFFLNGGTVDWKSAKQSIFATSSAEAEYIAAFDASKEAI